MLSRRINSKFHPRMITSSKNATMLYSSNTLLQVNHNPNTITFMNTVHHYNVVSNNIKANNMTASMCINTPKIATFSSSRKKNRGYAQKLRNAKNASSHDSTNTNGNHSNSNSIHGNNNSTGFLPQFDSTALTFLVIFPLCATGLLVYFNDDMRREVEMNWGVLKSSSQSSTPSLYSSNNSNHDFTNNYNVSDVHAAHDQSEQGFNKTKK